MSFSRGSGRDRPARLARVSYGRISRVRPRREKRQSTRLKLAKLHAVKACTRQSGALLLCSLHLDRHVMKMIAILPSSSAQTSLRELRQQLSDCIAAACKKSAESSLNLPVECLLQGYRVSQGP